MMQMRWTVASLAAQRIGRTGPIPEAPGGFSWASLLAIALLLAVISADALAMSLDYGMRQRAWWWASAFLMSTLFAAYSLWRLA
jgi:hypothetical protein